MGGKYQKNGLKLNIKIKWLERFAYLVNLLKTIYYSLTISLKSKKNLKCLAKKLTNKDSFF